MAYSLVQNALISILDPTFGIRHRAGEIGVVSAIIVGDLTLGLWFFRRKVRHRNTTHPA